MGGLDIATVAASPVVIGNTHRPLGDFFEIVGEPGARLVVRGAPPWSRIGARMAAGELVFEGDAGDELGVSMTGGLIRVTGSAGHRVAGPDFGTTRGANGGTVIVHGNVGDHAGLRLRRGLVVVGGSAGASPGFRMLAGTIVVARGPLDHALLEARRGTVLALDAAASSLAGTHLVSDGRFPVESITALRLLLAHLKSLGLAVPQPVWDGAVELWSGDCFELGKGELWQWVN